MSKWEVIRNVETERPTNKSAAAIGLLFAFTT